MLQKISITEIEEMWLEEIRLVIKVCFIWGMCSLKSLSVLWGGGPDSGL